LLISSVSRGVRMIGYIVKHSEITGGLRPMSRKAGEL
jgi:hypothetical protein